MKILLADDMDIVREGIACEIKNVIPDAEIDDFSDGKYAWQMHGICMVRSMNFERRWIG